MFIADDISKLFVKRTDALSLQKITNANLHKSVHVNFNRHNLGRILNYKSLHNVNVWCLGLSSFVRIPRRALSSYVGG